jgi:hypothetical protein
MPAEHSERQQRGCDPLATQDIDNATRLHAKLGHEVKAKLAAGLPAQRAIEAQPAPNFGGASYGERWRWLYRNSGRTSIPALDATHLIVIRKRLVPHGVLV